MFCFSAYFIEYLSKIDPSFFLFLTENKNRMILLKVGNGSTNPDIISHYSRIWSGKVTKKNYLFRESGLQKGEPLKTKVDLGTVKLSSCTE